MSNLVRKLGPTVPRSLGALALLSATVPRSLGAMVAQCPDGSPPPCRTAARPSGPPAASVAVLYFDNLSRDTADAYLAEGLTEQTIAQLGEVERLTVASRFAVRRFRGGEAADPAAVGRALNVSYLVTGSVQRSGSRLRVGVELVRANTGVRVWGERYDRTETDLLRLQDDIATAVAGGIVGRLLPAERRVLEARPTRDPVAWDRFLRGNYLMARRETGPLQQAIRDYEAAVTADPGFTSAVARIAYAYALAVENEYDFGMPRDSMVARGLAMAERALRLDSLSSDAWMAAAYIRIGAHPLTMEGVRERFERAVVLDPRNAEAFHQYGSYLGYLGEMDASLRAARRALELEPGRAITWLHMAELSFQGGRYREALALADSALAGDPGFPMAHVHRFMALYGLRDTAAARGATRVMMANPTFQLVGQFLDAFLTESARTDSGRVARYMATYGSMPVSPTQPGNVIGNGFGGMFLAQLGGREEALFALESARPRSARLHDLMRWPFYDPIRDEPRFQALWRETRAPGSVR